MIFPPDTNRFSDVTPVVLIDVTSNSPIVVFVNCTFVELILDAKIEDEVIFVNCPFVNNPFDIVDDDA